MNAPTKINSRRGMVVHPHIDQGSEAWLKLRCGLITASEVKLFLTPTLKVASNDKERAHLYELVAQRITGFVEPHYVSDDMLRGQVDEIEARAMYEKKHGKVETVGFITNDKFGFTMGYSPDGLVGPEGLIEAKSRRMKYQVQTIVEHVTDGTIPPEYILQPQAGMMIAEKKWCDFISYSGGLPMPEIRVWPDDVIQNAIEEAAGEFERRIAAKIARFEEVVAAHNMPATERRVEEEMFI